MRVTARIRPIIIRGHPGLRTVLLLGSAGVNIVDGSVGAATVATGCATGSLTVNETQFSEPTPFWQCRTDIFFALLLPAVAAIAVSTFLAAMWFWSFLIRRAFGSICDPPRGALNENRRAARLYAFHHSCSVVLKSETTLQIF